MGFPDDEKRRRACVFAPSPLVTVTIEQGADEEHPDEIHLHAGGQGFWIARMLAELASTSCCADRSAARPVWSPAR